MACRMDAEVVEKQSPSYRALCAAVYGEQEGKKVDDKVVNLFCREEALADEVLYLSSLLNTQTDPLH